MSSSGTLQELSVQLTNSITGGSLTLSSTTISAPTFSWSLQTMGVKSLVLQIPDPTTGIVYNETTATLTITGSCIAYSNWNATVYTIVLSSGDAGHTVTYANTDISATYDTFNISNIAGSGLVPSGSVTASLLPTYLMDNVPMSVISTSASTLPNCTLNFGVAAAAITPPWPIVSSLGLSMTSMGFVVANTMSKTNIITRTFDLSGGVKIGSILVDITVTIPVNNDSQSNIWALSFSSEVGETGLNIANLVQNLGGINVYQEFPSSLTALMGFTLTNFYTQFDPSTLTVNQIQINIGAPTWNVTDSFSIENTNFSVQTYNPFDSVSRSTTLSISGDFKVTSGNQTVALLSAMAVLPLGASDWFFNISGEINNVNYTTLIGSTPGFDTYAPPAAPNGFELEKIILNYLNISYNPTLGNLTEVSLSVNSVLEFPVVPGIIGVSDPYFTLNLTNPGSDSNFNYEGSVGGTVTLTNAPFLDLEAAVAKETGWVYTAALSEGATINIIDLLDQFFANSSTVPPWVGSELEITALSLVIKTAPSGQTTPATEYIVSGTVMWKLVVGAFNLPEATAVVEIDYQKPDVSGTITVTTTLFGLDFLIGYKFASGNQINSQEVFLTWNGITADYQYVENQYSKYSLTVSNLSLGGLITSVMSDIIPGFTLSPPWNLLNDINLNGLSIACTQYVKAADQSKNSLIVKLPINLDLGFINIKNATLTRMGTGSGSQTYLGFEGTFLGFEISSDSPNESAKQLAGTGSPVSNMPSVPGLGGNIFDLQYFGLGQHVALYPTQNLDSVTKAVDALKNVFQDPPTQTPGQPPIIPIPPKPSSPPTESILIFDGTSNWLIGLQCNILNTVKLGVVFNDPNLYGLAVALSGEKAGIFDGLDFEILYKKINDSIGMYQIDLQLPTAMRTLEFGAVSITLPSASVQIYTNGNFMVDLGFPWNNDFSRSFTIQAFPFIGQGGFYFGVLNGTTSSNVPKSDVGSFSPVIELGVGLSLGVGKTVDAGILSAGLSVMAVGVFQGVLAQFNTNSPDYWGDGDFYYKATGTFGITGRIYGSVNFAIISARLDITAYAYVTITIEAYNLIAINFTAGVSVSLRVTVNLGIFKIHITLKFSATVSASFTIGTNNTANAPWNQPKLNYSAKRAMAMRSGMLSDAVLSYNILWKPLTQTGTKPAINLMYLPLLSVSDATGTNQAQFVNALFIDALDPSDDTGTLDSGFTSLTKAVLQWAINAIINSSSQDPTNVDDLMKQAVTLDQLQAIFCYLTYETDNCFPILYSNTWNDKEFDIRAFLESYFTITISAQNIDNEEASNATIFPMFPDLILNDNLNGTPGTPVDFSANPQPFSYVDQVQVQLEELAVEYQSAAEAQNDESASDCPTVTDASLPATPPNVSFATFIIQDYFEMIVKNVVQDAIDSFDSYTYTITAATTLNDVVVNFTSAPLNNQLTAANVVTANPSVTLNETQPFNLVGITYPIAANDTFNSIIALYNKGLQPANQITAAQLGTDGNSVINGLIVQGTVVTVAGFNPYTTIATDTLTSIAAALTPVSGNATATVSDVINAVAGSAVLATLCVIEIPTLTYTTGAADTFASIATVYGVTTAMLAAGNPDITFNATSLIVPGITTLHVEDVVDQVIVVKNINSYSGMTSRFLLHGLNLPDPNDMNEVKPLYVLTGQQLTVPALKQGDLYNLQLTQGANGSWINLAANPLSLPVDNNEISRIADVLTFTDLTQSTTTQPPAPLQLYMDAYVAYTLKSRIPWQYPGALTLPIGTAPSQVVGTPSLWYFPDSLTGALQDTTQDLELELLIQTLNSDGKTYTQSNVTNYGWSTLINIGVEKITDSNEQAPIFANTYNLSGASGGDIVYLERLVAALNSGNGPKIDQIRILYDPNASGNASTTGVQSISDGAYEIGVVKINLSTETNPEVSLRMALATEETGYSAPEPNTLNEYIDFLSYVWECSIVRSGGFYLYFNQNDGGAGLPDSLFSTNPMANLYLLVTYQGEASGDYMNAVAVGDPIDIDTSVLFVQSEALKTRNAIMSPGNAGFQLTIDNPGPYDPINPYPIPATPESHTSDQLFLQNQFNLIGYQLLKNDAFTGSPESLMPVGPLYTSNPGDPESEKDTDTDNWPYQGTLPIASYAVSRISPSNPDYPPASGDPYSGNGESALIQLSLVDLFGNPINSNISGEDGLITIDLAYTDNIIALSQWPGVTPRYSFTGTTDKPRLKLDLCFDTSRYEQSDDKTDTGGPTPKELALADMGTYASIYYQLIQPDVVVSYRTSLYISETYPEGVPLTPDNVISDYVGTIYAYLSNIANGKPQTVTVPVPWSISSEVSASNLENIYELITDLTIQRTSNISPDFKDVAAVSSVTTLIQPITQELCTSDSSTSATLTYFATGFEQIFSSTQIPGAYMKVASGVDSDNVSSNGNSQKVWVVRFDPTGEYGINVAFNQSGKEPISYYYSPGPLSTSLQTLNNVPITPYVTGQAFNYNPAAPTKNFSTVDMDQWALVCLQAIDNFLSPQYSVPAFLLDNGTTLQSVLDAKENLANYITGTVTNVLDQPLTEAQITNAQEVFNQQLLISLGNAYNISTIIQHPVTVGSDYTGSNVAPNNVEPINPRFYGSMYGIDPQPVGNYSSTDVSNQYSFTNTKIPLGEGASWVNYCLYVKDAAQVESFQFSQINFVLSNIEHQIENIPNVEGYQASTWLNFVIPLPNNQFNTGGKVDIPVPLRAYPIPPSVTSQSASYDQNNVTGETTTIDAALEWGFNFQYSQQEATQDMINAQVAFNSSIPLMMTPPQGEQSISLVDALAQFISVLPALTADFLEYVAAVTPKDVAADNDTAKYAKTAVQSLANLSDLVATGWSTYHQYNPWPPVTEDYANRKKTLTLEENGVILNYTIDETESVKGNPDSAMTLTITADSGNPSNIALPMATIDGYTTITVEETADSVSYQFQDSSKNPLSYANRQVVNTRSLAFTPLDLMEYQEGWAGLQITRNQDLVPEFQTNPLFLYQTPLVKFYTPLTPLLTANALIDISAINASGKPEVNYMAVQLQNLFNAIFDVYQLGNPTIRLEALYSYNLNGEATWNQIHLPVFLALPFVLDLSTDLNIGSAPPYCETTESFICTVSKTLLDWYDTVKPSPTNGQFTFKLIIYSASDNTTPLISLTDLSLGITEITELN
jgi:LysM repeat protein